MTRCRKRVYGRSVLAAITQPDTQVRGRSQLELGGAPRDPKNLWPEPRYDAGGNTAGDKDTTENALKKKVCAGAITLAAAQHIMATDWRQGR